MDISLADLRYFLEIATTLNISRAAERLGIRQSTLSASLAKVEASVEARLFVRSKSGVQLTKAGRAFLGSAKNLVEQWTTLRTSTRDEEEEISGRFTIGCHSAVASYLLPKCLGGLIKDHPKLELKLVHETSQVLNERVADLSLDFAIVSFVLPHPDFVVAPLQKDQVWFWMAAGQKADPLGLPLVLNPEMRYAQTLLKELRKKKLSFAKTITSPSIEVIRAFAEAGLGVAILPKNFVTSQVATKLRQIDSLPHFTGALSLIYRGDAQKNRAARTIIQAIRAGGTVR